MWRWDKHYWTPERAQRAREMWTQGCSAGEIAAVLGNVTRNAVIGKLQRLKARGGKNKALETGKRQLARRKPARATQLIVHVPTIPIVLSANAADRSFNTVSGPYYGLAGVGPFACKWPIGFPEKKDFCFCAAPRQNFVEPYCESHNALSKSPSSR